MRFFFLVLVGSAIAGTAACGGKVVVENNVVTTGGDGGSSSTSSSSSPSVGSGTGLDASFCDQVCKSMMAAGCTGADCVDRCKSTATAAPECFEAAKAAVFCIADHAQDAPGCTSAPCDDLMTTFETCTSASSCAKALVGTQNPGICIGKGVCGGGGDEWIATCTEAGLCECSINNGVLGTCQETGPFLCDFRRGCCGQLFPTND